VVREPRLRADDQKHDVVQAQYDVLKDKLNAALQAHTADTGRSK